MQSSKLYVGNFGYSTIDEQLEKLFSPFGQVKSATVIGNKGFGFVEMSDKSEAEKAKEALDGSDFEGRTLRVNEARPQVSRSDRNFGRY
ncbi:RNA-binding protein [bacterium]|nr:RNA-binding protein [bacterium]